MLNIVNNWPLPKKMLVVFGFLGVLIAGLTWNGVTSNHKLSAVAKRHVERGIAGISSLGQLRSELKEERIIVYSYQNMSDAAEGASLEKRLVENHMNLKSDLEAYAKVAGEEFQDDVDAFRSRVDQLIAVNTQIFDLRRAGRGDESLRLVKNEGKDASRAAQDVAERLLKRSRERSENAKIAGEATMSQSLMLTILLSAVTMIGLALVWLLINRTVAKPLGKLTGTTAILAEGGSAEVPFRDRQDELGQIARAVEQFRMAAVQRAEADARAAAEQQVVTSTLRDSLAALKQGDLTAQIETEFPSVYAELKVNFNEAVASLHRLIGAVMETTKTIRTGSGEIAQASEDLARRTEANAASLEETSAAVTQMDERLKATAAAANRTVERADGAIATVTDGRSTADEAMQAMTRVSESAKGIDSVIEGLDKIAFQTRVLAMNAAVEAGRAGEAGRGFAVVADLVSALAMRAEEEAGRARDQLTATQTDIVAAVDMVQKVDAALAGISGSVSEVHDLLGHIASDNQAQSTAITQISVAIGSMDQSTQQNAAMVEETSAAARNLSSEVSNLAEQASQFRIGATSAPAMAAPRRTASTKSARSEGYVSPVKALPVAAMASGSGQHDDWASF